MKKLPDIKLLFKCYKTINSFSPNIILIQIIKAVTDSLFPFITIYMSAEIVDSLIAGSDYKRVFAYALLTVALSFGVKIISVVLSRILNIKYLVFSNNYSKSKSLKIPDLDYSTIEDSETRQKLNKIEQYENMNGGGLTSIYHSTSSFLRSFFTLAFSVALTISLFVLPYPSEGSLITKLAVNPIVGIIILALIFVYVIFNSKVAVKCTRYANSEYSKFTFINDLSSELTSHIYYNKTAMDIRIYGQTEAIMQHAHETMQMSYDINGNTNMYSLKKMHIPGELIRLFTQFLIYIFAAFGALAGRFSIGSITKYISALSNFSGAIKQIMVTGEQLRYNCEIAKLYFDFVEIPSEMKSGERKIAPQESHEFEFRNVSFKYPNTDIYVLKNLSYKIKQGKKLAIVGMNGCGKTTLVKLLCRLYDPTEGEILLDGINIKEYGYSDYLKAFSIVFQDYSLFAMSLAQNISCDETYEKQKVLSCLDEVGFSERLASLENGIDTVLYRDFERNGVMISGGEAQKIAMARALYKDAPIVIFDEPTAALDPISESEIYKRLNAIVKERTAIFISHRLSSCVFSDEILVMDSGEIVQSGSHEKLLSDAGGKYHELWNAQAQFYV